MYTEIQTAVTFLAKLLQSKSTPASATPERISTFQEILVQRMLKKYKGHWDPHRPCKGNAYRAVCILNGVVERGVVEAVEGAGIRLEDLTFPSELVLWIDPHCVSYRMGDFGQVVTVWENKAALESEAVQIPHFFKASHRTRSPSATFSRPQSQTPPPPPSASQSQSQTPPPPSNAMHHPHYQYQKAVMAN